jgi:hypothetical protein
MVGILFYHPGTSMDSGNLVKIVAVSRTKIFYNHDMSRVTTKTT